MAKRIIIIFSIFLALPMNTFGASSHIVDEKDSKYTYSDFTEDLNALTEKYPDRLTRTYLGNTADNRSLYCVVLGNPNARKQIFVTAGIHGREYINSQLVMDMIEYYCRNYKTGLYCGLSYEELFDSVSIVIVPMANPDGIAISALGPDSIRNAVLRKKVKKLPRTGAYSNWQANARGVDLNRNYKMYSTYPSTKSYASQYYPGPKRFSEAETQGILKALEACSNVQAVINYHSMGRVIYWGYHNKTYKAKCWSFVKLFRDMTGYSTIDESYTKATYGDFEHYIMHEYRVPYVCIENGISGVPVPNREFSYIFKKNKLGFAKAAYQYR